MTTNLDYNQLDRHVFRVAQGTILDFPLHPTPGATVWAATIWPDIRNGNTWARTLWAAGPGGRGFNLDPLIHLGDVIEFGADTPNRQHRWYGYVVHADAVSITAVGPFTNPHEAGLDGRNSLPSWFDAHIRTIDAARQGTGAVG